MPKRAMNPTHTATLRLMVPMPKSVRMLTSQTVKSMNHGWP